MCVDAANVYMELVFHHPLHIVALVQTQQAVIDKDTGQLASHRFLQQSGRHGAVHAAAERQQYPLVADFLAALGNGRVHIGGHGPLAAETADTVKEVFQNLRAVFGVHDLGVELHAVETAPFTLDGGMAAAL